MIASSVTKDEAWRESIEKAQKGDKGERDKLITGNTGLVYMVIKRFANRGHEAEDLFQIGMIGLMKAVDKFDVSRELSFSTYAVPMIMGEIRRFLRDDGIIHVSRQVKDNARRIAAVKEELGKNKNLDPTLEDLAGATGLSTEEVLAALDATGEVISIYQTVGQQDDGGSLTIADRLEAEGKEEELINQIVVRQMLDSLEPKERNLIILRYLEGKTQTESARILGMNQVAVSRLEKKVLLQLRKKYD